MKNEFTTHFLKYVLKGLFPCGILDGRFEPTSTKNHWISQRWNFYL